MIILLYISTEGIIYTVRRRVKFGWDELKSRRQEKKVKLDIRAKEEPESGGCDDWLVEKVDTKPGGGGGGSRSSLLFLGY